MRIDEIEKSELMKLNGVNGVRGLFVLLVLCKVGYWYFFQTTLHATHFARSLLTNSYYLGNIFFLSE